MKKKVIKIPNPSVAQVRKYLRKWDTLGNYVLQENALNKLFFEICPKNRSIDDILIKASCLNDFYSTNIFSIFPVAKHIQSLHIDSRLKKCDLALVDDIAHITIKNVKKHFYSFATKYCSHHKPNDYPIYDSYVKKVLMYFYRKDKFYSFKKSDLMNYKKFKEIIIAFSDYYMLSEFSLKEIDQYLWQFGKDYFPNKY